MTPNFIIKMDHTLDVNCGPRSHVISSGIPKYLKIYWNRSLAVINAVGRAGNGMNRTDFENRSTVTRIVVLPWDFGRSVTKSTEMWDQGRSGVGNGLSLPAGSVHGTLLCAQDKQDYTTACISSSILGHEYLSLRRGCVRCAPGCPVPSTVCAQIISSCRYSSGTNSLVGGQMTGPPQVQVSLQGIDDARRFNDVVLMIIDTFGGVTT